MGNSIRTTSNTQFIKNAQATIDSFSLANLENLTAPLQCLVKARDYLSVIHDEILHTARDGMFVRSKIGNFTANLYAELEQIPLVFLSCDNELMEMSEPLSVMAKQLYVSIYAIDSLTPKAFQDITRQTLDIYECLEQIIMLALYRQAEGR